jgi:hypothetical protein
MLWAHGCVLSYCEWMYTVSLLHQPPLMCGLNLQGTGGLWQHSLKGRWSSVGCPCGRFAAHITTWQVIVVKVCTPAREVCWVARLITAGCHHGAETVLCFITDWSVLPSKLNGLWNTQWRCCTFVIAIVISKAQIKFLDVHLTSWIATSLTAEWVVWHSMGGETGSLTG